MTDEDQAALGRFGSEASVVSRYVEVVIAARGRRRRSLLRETLRKRLVDLEHDLETARPCQRLALARERDDLTARLAAMHDPEEAPGLEESFVKVAKSYGERNGIDYRTWRRIGVSRPVLVRAGIAPSG